jgi:hypothetical protein
MWTAGRKEGGALLPASLHQVRTDGWVVAQDRWFAGKEETMESATKTRRGCMDMPPDDSGWRAGKGFMLLSLEVDLREGGASRIHLRSPEGEDSWVEGACLELLEPERIVLSGYVEVDGEKLHSPPGYVTFRRG